MIQSVGRSIGRSIGRSVSRSVSRSMIQSVDRPVGRSVGQSQSPVGISVCHTVKFVAYVYPMNSHSCTTINIS